MKYPNFGEEKKLWKKGFKFVAGLDEAGRGPLAGPVVAAAVNFKFEIRNLKINDSKKLNAKQREEIYKKLIKNKNIKYGVGVVSEKIIDKINILQATKLAMQKAFNALIIKRGCNHKLRYRVDCDDSCCLLIDGNFGLDNIKIRQKSIIKGDQKVMSIAAASIIAKVTRDRLIQKYHKKYPQYGFDKHKGYGTKTHFASLKKFGPCKIHRRSFYPINSYPQVDICLKKIKEVK